MEVKTIPHHALYGGTCHEIEPHLSHEYLAWWHRMARKYFTPTSPDQWTVTHGARSPFGDHRG